jgi:hypothetical protein
MLIFDVGVWSGLSPVLLASLKPFGSRSHSQGFEKLLFSLLYSYKHRSLPVCGRKFFLPVITYKTSESSKSLTKIGPIKFYFTGGAARAL